MVDFVKELVSCHNKSTQLPLFPDKVKGYTENELNLIAKKCNLDRLCCIKLFLKASSAI